MTTRDEIAWLVRRAGWGLRPGQLDDLVALGTDGVLDLLVDPDSAGLARDPGPFAGVEEQSDRQQQARFELVEDWIDHLGSTQRPLEDRLAWFWHDHFAVSGAAIGYLPAFARHLELLRTSALGSFPRFIKDMTVDSAMLVFLNGDTSTGRSPNENYGRELLELYTMGVGNYTEDDVRAAAGALTGWVVRRRLDWEVQFAARRHDPTPRSFLGAEVSDVESVVDAIMAHPSVPGFVAGKLARTLLGGDVSGVVDRLADVFAAADLAIAPLARATLEAGLDGAGASIIVEPFRWLVAAQVATGAQLPVRARLGLLRGAGQVPGAPPNVGGFPPPSAWLSSSATAARFTMANVIAQATADEEPVVQAAAAGEFDVLADLLLRPGGFSAATLDALTSLPASAGGRPGRAELAIALSSPDLLVA